MLKNTIKKTVLRLFTFSSALFMMNFNVLADLNSNISENEISVLADGSLKGDLDENGTLTYSDLSILQQYLAGTKQLSANQLTLADVNSDNEVNEKDLYSLANTLKQIKFPYSNKVWNVSDMPLGEIYGYDGLHILQVDSTNKNKVSVASSNKKYGNKSFSKCIKTGGDAQADNYVPRYRALKLDIDKPCKMTIYSIAGSTTANNPTMLVTKRGKIINQIPLSSEAIKKDEVNLLTPDTYYIYSSDDSGSANIYCIELNEINGDLSLDGKITQDDVSLLQGYIAGTVTLTETQKGQADVNKDGLINSNDLNALENILNSEVVLKEDSASASYGVTAGKDYTLYLTVTNIISKSDYTYEVKYAPDVLQLAEIGLGEKTKFNSYSNIKYSEDIQILSNSNGTLRFKVNSIGKNWSGILSSVTFKALKTGQTSISFGGKAGYIK
jgi:hypothetical protein